MKIVRALKFTAIVSLLFTQAALAQSVKLNRPGESWVIVWQNGSASRQGNALMNEPGGIDLIMPFVACVVKSGTLAIITSDTGYFKWVVVAEGDYQGCRGVVSPGDI
ncbi:hypothetical protein NKI61_31365 [Mesorhizobium sp. M0514]|uniref:hypothetical protein n=1 Tax=Mesorhizobium sp. M0514 TaxID=2956955 RepID=UPI00333DDF5F